MAFTAMEVARDCGADVLEASLSDTHMRLKFVSRQVWDAVDTNRSGNNGNWYAGGLGSQEYLGKVGARSHGDMPGGPGTIHPVVTISNSDTGHGGAHARIGILQAVCYNVATVEDVCREIHLGSKLDAGVFTSETRAADDESTMLKMKDSIIAAFSRDKFKSIVAKVKNANNKGIENPTDAVDNIVKTHKMTDIQRDLILAHFIGGNVTKTQYGLGQAVARAAQDVDSGDVAVEMEDLAGQLVTC